MSPTVNTTIISINNIELYCFYYYYYSYIFLSDNYSTTLISSNLSFSNILIVFNASIKVYFKRSFSS